MINKIIQGDSLEVLKTLSSESIDCVITSPPYYGLRSYLKKDDPLKVKEIGSESSIEEHLRVLMAIIGEIKRVLKPTGSFWLNYGDCYGGCKEGKTDKKVSDYIKKEQEGICKKLPGYEKCMMMLPERIALRMIDQKNWILRSKIIWCKQIMDYKTKTTKGSVMPTSVKDRFNNSFEYLYHFVKNKKYYFDLDAVRIKNQVIGISDFRPNTGGFVDPKKLYNSKFNKFNYRVRDAIRKEGQPQFKASEEEIKNYQGKFTNNQEAESFGSPRARTQRGKSWHPHEDDLTTGNIKSVPSSTHKNGKNIPNVWLIGIEPSRELHFARFPSALCEIPILSSCPENGIVCDPFCGSGTALAVAKKLGRNFIGIELNKDYIKLAEERIAGQTLPML